MKLIKLDRALACRPKGYLITESHPLGHQGSPTAIVTDVQLRTGDGFWLAMVESRAAFDVKGAQRIGRDVGNVAGRLRKSFRLPYSTPTVELAGKVLPLRERRQGRIDVHVVAEELVRAKGGGIARVQFHAAVLKGHAICRQRPAAAVVVDVQARTGDRILVSDGQASAASRCTGRLSE